MVGDFHVIYCGVFGQCTKRNSHILLAPAVTVGETEGAMDSASVFFTCSFAYNFARK